jgi:hypothetical protein
LGRESAHLLSRGDANLAPIGRAPCLARGKRNSRTTAFAIWAVPDGTIPIAR